MDAVTTLWNCQMTRKSGSRRQAHSASHEERCAEKSELISRTNGDTHNNSHKISIGKLWADSHLSVISMVISIIAACISAGGLYTSREALRQAEEQYVDERAIILTAHFGETAGALSVKPTDSATHFSEGIMEFPSLISSTPQKIGEDGGVWGMGSGGNFC